jgi:hypothetical protein
MNSSQLRYQRWHPTSSLEEMDRAGESPTHQLCQLLGGFKTPEICESQLGASSPSLGKKNGVYICVYVYTPQQEYQLA